MYSRTVITLSGQIKQLAMFSYMVTSLPLRHLINLILVLVAYTPRSIASSALAQAVMILRESTQSFMRPECRGRYGGCSCRIETSFLVCLRGHQGRWITFKSALLAAFFEQRKNLLLQSEWSQAHGIASGIFWKCLIYLPFRTIKDNSSLFLRRLLETGLIIPLMKTRHTHIYLRQLKQQHPHQQ